MKNLPSLYEMLASEKAMYDRRRKSARAFYKFYGNRNVKPLDKKDGVGPSGDYYIIDGIEYFATGYDTWNFRILLKPLIIGPIIVKEF